MKPWARLVLAVVGLAAAVYAGASLTGGWLGTPPWWERAITREVFRPGLSDGGWYTVEDRLPREHRVLASSVVCALGLSVLVFAAWPRRGKPALGARGWTRVMVGGLGLAAMVYGIASITGVWLGTPPWWKQWFTEEEWSVTHDQLYEGLSDQRKVDFVREAHNSEFRRNVLNPRKWDIHAPRPGRERISLAVSAAGLALFAWAGWPRRAPGDSMTRA